jgi:hypothetical protein
MCRDPNVLTLPKPKTWRLARKIDAAMHRRIEEASIAPTGSAPFLSLVIGRACRRAQRRSLWRDSHLT